MTESLQILKQEAKALKRFRYLKIAGFFLIVFLVAFVAIIILGIIGFDNQLTTLFFVSFFSFIIAFISLVIHFFTSGIKELKFKKMLFDMIWTPIITTNTFSYDNDYMLTVEKVGQNRVIDHSFLPNHAGERYEYAIKNTTTDTYMHALSYATTNTTQNGSSSTTHFHGVAIETNIPVNGSLFVRSNGWYKKLSSKLGAFKDYRIEGDIIINGEYNDTLKKIREHLLNQGYKDVMLIDQNGKLMVLISLYPLVPKMKKYDEHTYQTHERFLMRLIDTKEYLSQFE